MLVGGNDKHQMEVWSKLALERLLANGLPPTPCNYSVHYHYVAGDVPALLGPYDALIMSGIKLTQQHCAELYEKYISTDGNTDFLQDASHVLDVELKKVTDLISASLKGNNEFGENLDNFTGKLTNAPSIEVLREAVVKISGETRSMAAENSRLQNELEAATQQLTEIRSDFDRVHKEAHIDALTEIGNRKFFDREIANKLEEAKAQNSNLSLLMIDIDYFKNFNDTHGHLLGDQVLRLVARTLVDNLKGRDVIARYGGEEFVILLPQTRLQDAERVGNQLRNSLAAMRIRKKGSSEVLGVVTISIGAAQYTLGEDSENLISRADSALYKAKQTGRNRVVCFYAGEGAKAEAKP